MFGGRRKFITLIVAIAAIVLLLVGVRSLLKAPVAGQPEQRDSAAAGSDALARQDKASVQVGGVRRPRQDLAEDVAPADDDEDLESGIPDVGMITPVALDANPQVAAVAKLYENRFEQPDEFAASVAVLAPQQAFDFQRFQQDAAFRETYLNTVTPGRVFQPAQPSETVQSIQALSPSFQQMNQGEAVRLRVLGTPGAPYTFTSLDLGQFTANSLTSITVQAGPDGEASAEFTAGPGTFSDVGILVAGPVSSGQVRFTVNVVVP